MKFIIKGIDKLTEQIGKLVSWLSLVLVIVICFDVVMRYAFDSSSAAMFEFEWHIFAALFMLSMAYAFKYDKHVRVDVFYAQFSEKGRALVNFIGTAFFLIPFCLVLIKTSIPFVVDSYEVMESSPDPGGLAYRFFIKSTIPLGASLLFMQAIAILLKAFSELINKKGITE